MSQPVVLKPIGKKKKRVALLAHSFVSQQKKKKRFHRVVSLVVRQQGRCEPSDLWTFQALKMSMTSSLKISAPHSASGCVQTRKRGKETKKKAKRTTIMRGAKKKKRRMWASKRNVFKRRVCSARYPDIRHVCKHYQMVLLLNKRTGTHVCGPFRVTQKKKKLESVERRKKKK